MSRQHPSKTDMVASCCCRRFSWGQTLGQPIHDLTIQRRDMRMNTSERKKGLLTEEDVGDIHHEPTSESTSSRKIDEPANG